MTIFRLKVSRQKPEIAPAMKCNIVQTQPLIVLKQKIMKKCQKTDFTRVAIL